MSNKIILKKHHNMIEIHHEEIQERPYAVHFDVDNIKSTILDLSTQLCKEFLTEREIDELIKQCFIHKI